ncbi:hypothetical protein HYALB_00004871 [Hymenoscyphus albidus]|uniref:F-box domain-containing protein n=1 Tax=Hymenoscyphus albidus TaxID=595503 RepID=A0A9N9Q118_9HELO|nr:hypothetical protein HYALB_00004871 [Hymenoscyphus albidus]
MPYSNHSGALTASDDLAPSLSLHNFTTSSSTNNFRPDENLVDKMELLALPDEILLFIIKETIPEQFEDFALSCKTIYRLGTQYLSRHNELRKEYKNFTSTLRRPCTSPFNLLLEIADTPTISRYIVYADFREYHPTHVLRKHDLLSSLLKLLEESSYLKRIGGDPFVIHQVFRTGNYRNERLPINQAALLNYIVHKANNPRNSSSSLSKLTTILPSGAPNRLQTSMMITTLYPFISIKSMQNFYAGSSVAIQGFLGDHDTSGVENADTFGRSLELVESHNSPMMVADLEIFLSRLPRLRSLKLIHIYFAGFRDSAAIMGVVEKSTFETLETLTFMMCPTSVAVTSMKRFKRLRKLEININVLLGLLHVSGCERRLHHCHDISHLGDLLPSSIETFTLLVDDLTERSNDLEILFENVAAERSQKLPNLKEISIRSGLPELLERSILSPNFSRDHPNTSPRSDYSDIELIIHSEPLIYEGGLYHEGMAAWMGSLQEFGTSVKVNTEVVLERGAQKVFMDDSEDVVMTEDGSMILRS